MADALAARDERAARLVRRWLYMVALLVCAMVLIGGATRLTDSGLSITEWRPVTGALLPLTEEAWFEEFIRYQGIPEYQIVNRGMSIDEFKTIYIWEWVHRNFGRLIALAYALPLAWLVASGRARGRLAGRLFAILGLGAVQALAGWYMVASGIGPDSDVDVSHYRLAVHLGLACVILGALVWTALDLLPRPARAGGRSAGESAARRGAALLLGLVFAQILAGALVAGLDAGLTYNTWPLMDGAVVPDGLLAMSPWHLNFFENPLTVQFDHRLIAYILLAAALVHALQVRGEQARRRALWIAGLVAAQIALGVATLLASVPIPLGLAHQAMAMVVFVAVVHHLHGAWNAAPERAGTEPAPAR